MEVNGSNSTSLSAQMLEQLQKQQEAKAAEQAQSTNETQDVSATATANKSDSIIISGNAPQQPTIENNEDTGGITPSPLASTTMSTTEADELGAGPSEKKAETMKLVAMETYAASIEELDLPENQIPSNNNTNQTSNPLDDGKNVNVNININVDENNNTNSNKTNPENAPLGPGPEVISSPNPEDPTQTQRVVENAGRS